MGGWTKDSLMEYGRLIGMSPSINQPIFAYKPKSKAISGALYPLLERCNIYYDTLIAI
ncbi:MAG: hypothetical protein IPL23_15475 [Saprospiraceae bacterium]|nr:hypothetical protein [Saprospiraceae bacterium]